jgi:CubicO group peptidase (beta-lactamase class C family)
VYSISSARIATACLTCTNDERHIAARVSGSPRASLDPVRMAPMLRFMLVLIAAFYLIVAGDGRAMAQPLRATASHALPVLNTPQRDTGNNGPVLASHPLTAADLEAWMDGMLPAALKQGKVAGVVVSVVKDGRLILAKGYGFADVAAKRPMDPYRTLVRPGSTSKLFTWTAVMQLVEQGKLGLNVDVNRYLDFKVPEPYGHPITLNDLMTHRAGFEEGLKDAIVSDPAQLEPLGVFLRRHVRPVLFSPGSVPAYSNYGTALAGYIVQRVSGERFDAYVARHIFAPLQMRNSTFTQPLVGHAVGSMSRGYMSAQDSPKPFELISFAPAGALSATAADMANFMIAHLQDGRFQDASILRPETARFMHSASLPHAVGFDTIAHGFFLNQRNGRVVLEHGGDTIVFHSDLAIIPAEQTGIFLSFNSRGEGDAVYGMRERLLDGFMDRYFPGQAPPSPPALSTALEDAGRIAGRYETSRRVQDGFMSLFYVLQGQEIISANSDGTISLSSSPGIHFREIAPRLWREVDGFRMISVGDVGGLKTIADSHNPAGVLQLVPLRRNASVNLWVFLASLVVLLGTAIAWPVAEIARRVHQREPALTGRALLIRRLARIAAVADLVYLAAWFVVLKPILGNEVSFYTAGLDPMIRSLQIAGIVPIAGAVAGASHAWLSVRSGQPRIVKMGSVLVAAALIGVVWIATVGGLLSFTLNY